MRRLVNRRFVPLYFDLAPDGAAADPAARAFVVAARPALAEAAVPTPNALLMTPDGEVVGELDPYLEPRAFLDGLRRCLEAHAEFTRLSASERGLSDPLERAELALDLGDLAGARAILAGAEGARARWLAGHVARLQGDLDGMEAELARVDDADLAEDVRAERAHAAWSKRDLEGVLRTTEGARPEGRRAAELLYLRGLALYHRGSQDAALEAWRVAIQGRAQDAWVYRADWAYSEVVDGRANGIASRARAGGSLLGRIGYLGRGNPDLLGL